MRAPLPSLSRVGLAVIVAVAACARPADDDPPVDTDPGDTEPPDTEPPDTEETDDTDGGPAVVGARLDASGIVRCPDVDRDPPFREDVTGAWAFQAYDPDSRSLFVGGGVGVADFSGDGRVDVILTAYTRAVRYYVAGDDGWIDRSGELPPVAERSAGVTPVDVDGDGDLDAMIAVYDGPNTLLLNDGTGGFTDAAAALGVASEEGIRHMSSSWADVDGDGDLDGFVAGYGRTGGPNGLPEGDPSQLYVQQPDGTFVDVVGPDAPAPLQTAHTFTGSWVDLEPDGFPELFMVNDFGWRTPSLFLDNQGGTLVSQDAVGVESQLENMGLGVGDLNEDGVMDFFLTAWDGYRLFESRAGFWFDTHKARGLVPDTDAGQNVAWGAELADLDNDGDLDAPVVHGHLAVRSNNTNPEAQPDAVFLQGDDGRFSDVAPSWGLADPARNRAVLAVDVDGNGWLDLVTTDLRGPARIYLQQCGEAGWLSVEVRQPGTRNPFGIGARVTVIDGERRWTHDIRAGGTSYGSAGPPIAHVGLGDRDVVERIEVRWPDGEVAVAEGVSTRQHLRFTRE